MSRTRPDKGAQWRNRLGNRPPKGYRLDIPTKVKTEPVKGAIEAVLNIVQSSFYEDAVLLEERVGIILPLTKQKDCSGMWVPYPPTYRKYGKGIILIRDNGELDFDKACLVFAHECGHAVTSHERWEGKKFSEGRANYYIHYELVPSIVGG